MSKRLLKYTISFKIVKKRGEKRRQDAPLRNSKRLLESCEAVQTPGLEPCPRAVLPISRPQAKGVELGKIIFF